MKIVTQILILLVLIVSACRPKEAIQSDMEDMSPFDPSNQQTITYLDVTHINHFLENNPEALVADIRSRKDYDKAHLPGALNFPHNPKNKKRKIPEGLLELATDKPKRVYFIYGSKENYHAIDVVVRLAGKECQNLFCIRQDSGIEDWIKAGLPVVSTPSVVK